MKQAIGWFLVLLPFLVVIGLGTMADGIWTTLVSLGIALAIFLSILVGIILVVESEE